MRKEGKLEGEFSQQRRYKQKVELVISKSQIYNLFNHLQMRAVWLSCIPGQLSLKSNQSSGSAASNSFGYWVLEI